MRVCACVCVSIYHIGKTLGALGRCKAAMGDYEQAITCHKEHWTIMQVLVLPGAQAYTPPNMGGPGAQANAALNMGVVLWAQARVQHGDTAGSNTPAAHVVRGCGPFLWQGRPAAYIDSMCNVKHWLETALNLAQTHGFNDEKEFALLNLTFLAVDEGNEEEALGLLKQFLRSQVVNALGRCTGCSQRRGEEAPMLTCSGCGVAKFCSQDHQKMASKKDRSLRKAVRHKDVCPLLKKWRFVVNGKATAESCTPDLLALLRLNPWKRRQAPTATDPGAHV